MKRKRVKTHWSLIAYLITESKTEAGHWLLIRVTLVVPQVLGGSAHEVT